MAPSSLPLQYHLKTLGAAVVLHGHGYTVQLLLLLLPWLPSPRHGLCLLIHLVCGGIDNSCQSSFMGLPGASQTEGLVVRSETGFRSSRRVQCCGVEGGEGIGATRGPELESETRARILAGLRS